MKQFFLYGRTPVIYEDLPDGGLRILAYSPELDEWEFRPELWSAMDYDRSGLVEEVDEATLEQAVLQLKREVALRR